jgi:tRNA pseudouridine55 synthase
VSRDGLLLIDKAPGGTSHDVVQRARKILRQKRIGHCGTLDPDATGLLVLTLGQATRLTRFLIHAPKIYAGEIRFGVATDTYDASGKVTAQAPITGLEEPAIDAEMRRFEGTFEQKLPAYSARKVRGVRLYELARRGEEVPDASKQVTVAEFRRTAPLAEGRIAFRLSCSSGTYARALAHDLGAALSCGGHLASLRRIAVGPFEVDSALSLEAVAERLAEDVPLAPAWLPLADIPLPFSTCQVDAAEERRLRNGQTAVLRGVEATAGDWLRVVDRAGALVAVGSVAERIGSGALAVVQPRIVFPPAGL